MSAPAKSKAAAVYNAEGPEALLRMIGEAGGVRRVAAQYNENESTWNRWIARARAQTGKDWHDFVRGDNDNVIDETDSPPVAEQGPTIVSQKTPSPDRFEPEDADAEIDKGDAQEMASLPVPEETREQVSEYMAAVEEDDEDQASDLPQLAFQEDVPRGQFGRLRIPDARRPQDGAPTAEWFEYLTTVSEFREMVPEARLRVATKRNYAGFIPVSDLHVGKQGCRFSKCRALTEWGLEQPGYYFGGLGDWANCPTLRSPEADQLGRQICTLGVATAALYYLWKPVADAGRLAGVADGNHEQRIAKATGQDDISPMRYLAERLNVPYWGYETPLMVHVGEQTYCFYLNHGTGGGQTLGYILATLERMAWNNEADAIIMGHRHMKIAVERTKYGPQRVELPDLGFEWQTKFRWLICSGCMCDSVAGEWSRQKNLPPPTSGTVTLRAYADRRDVHARA